MFVFSRLAFAVPLTLRAGTQEASQTSEAPAVKYPDCLMVRGSLTSMMRSPCWYQP